MLARSLAEARRVVRDDGVVTIVFGHGDPEVWHRLLGVITAGGLYLTGSLGRDRQLVTKRCKGSLNAIHHKLMLVPVLFIMKEFFSQ